MLGAENFQRCIERVDIEVAPLAYMRGRTLDDSFIILDEAQNTTSEQMKMFLTRLGFNSKAVVTGDITQIDLPSGKKSGLKDAVKILKNIDDIAIMRLSEKDVVRHRLVQEIIKAYERVQKQVEDITKRNTDLDKQAFLSRLPMDTAITDIETTAGGTMMAAELLIQIDVYVKAKIDQIQEYSNIHLLAFGAKLDAMKECLNQDRNVLYTALSKSKVPFEKKGGNK
jgi:hypothetical protein